MATWCFHSSIQDTDPSHEDLLGNCWMLQKDVGCMAYMWSHVPMGHVIFESVCHAVHTKSTTTGFYFYSIRFKSRILLRIWRAYKRGDEQKGCEGIGIQSDGFSDYLNTRVKADLDDLKGTQSLVDMIGDTREFNKRRLSDYLSVETPRSVWKIGEKFAECYLADYRGALFPYNSIRDERNSKASMQGVDLVGLATVGDRTLFLFGEVKTSGQIGTPSVIYGRDGLICQLNRLMTDSRVRIELIKWLGKKLIDRNSGDPDVTAYSQTAEIYFGSRSEFKVVGIMVRDVDPDERDTMPVMRKIKMDNSAYVEILALYIPGSISALAEHVRTKT